MSMDISLDDLVIGLSHKEPSNYEFDDDEIYPQATDIRKPLRILNQKECIKVSWTFKLKKIICP